ncbi:MAG: DUF3570 domain-containing protein [Deltaproteobacteria bacterium]|nr:DUF3570 domain-containing protein [Deltaproteobacteria bacterium]
MAVRTSLVCAIALIARLASADSGDREILGGEGWRLESLELRTMYLDQDGRGFQSVDDGTPGKETMFIVQPSLLINARQNERVSHALTLPFDAITAASPDAVDATSSASRFNIAGDFDLRTTIKLDDDDTLTTRFVAHAEEWIGGGTIGAGWIRSLADDNATVSVNGTFGVDVFDDRNHLGDFLGKTARATGSVHAGASQLLSPTTVIDGSYGATYQRGNLRTGWNAVPVEGGIVEDEVFPDGRLRQVLSLRVSQRVPVTRSTAKLAYRGYVDSFGLHANSIEASVYQYIVNWLYVRGSYRFYDQNGVEFYTESMPLGFDDSTLRTADSDLAPLSSHQYTVSLKTVRERGPLKKWSLSAELFRYTRSNDLAITAVSLGVGRVL